MQLKPQDLLIAFKLTAWGQQRWTYARLANELGISTSEAHSSVKRGIRAQLLVKNEDDAALARAGTKLAQLGKVQLIRRKSGRSRIAPGSAPAARDNPAVIAPKALLEFVVHGARYAFVADLLPSGAGVRTALRDPLFGGATPDTDDQYVWPHPDGNQRGIGLKPLHPNVPFAAMQDAALYELLALFDAMRVGPPKERPACVKRLSLLIQGADAGPGSRSVSVAQVAAPAPGETALAEPTPTPARATAHQAPVQAEAKAKVASVQNKSIGLPPTEGQVSLEFND
jgi:hypothetical protein